MALPRSSMCRKNIHLLGHSAIFAGAAADRPVLKENNLLYEAGVLVACTQPFSFVASQFESSHGGLIGFEVRRETGKE